MPDNAPARVPNRNRVSPIVRKERTMSPLPFFAFGGTVILLAFLPAPRSEAGPQDPEVNRYIGAKACKNCHNGADKGECFDKWEKSHHAKAYETLGTPKAKEVAARLGIKDPQKSADCLKCHTTAHGVAEKEIKRGFKPGDGVQCESCHGPGEAHFKIRFREAEAGGAASPITAAEIRSKRDIAACRECHNDKSPTYKPFCLVERMEQIEHLDPRKKRTAEELGTLRAQCAPDCAKCAAAKDRKPGDGK
jgi:hypothetical protein